MPSHLFSSSAAVRLLAPSLGGERRASTSSAGEHASSQFRRSAPGMRSTERWMRHKDLLRAYAPSRRAARSTVWTHRGQSAQVRLTRDRHADVAVTSAARRAIRALVGNPPCSLAVDDRAGSARDGLCFGQPAIARLVDPLAVVADAGTRVKRVDRGLLAQPAERLVLV